MTKTLSHYINGREQDGNSGRHSAGYNPATGAVISQVPLASAEEVDLAVQAAQRAFVGWSATTPLRRARVLFKFKELIEANADRLAALISSEHGKVHDDALGEVTRGLEVVEFACGIPHLLKGEFSENVGTQVDAYSIRQPLGVVAGITPFNFPAMVPMWMFPVARPAVTPSSSSLPSATRRPRCCWPICSSRPVCRMVCSTSCTATSWRSMHCSNTRRSKR